MKHDELLSVLRLQATKHVGTITAKKLISTFGSADAIFQQSPSAITQINGIGSLVTSELFKDDYLKLAEQELNYILKNNSHYVYFLDKTYPQALKHCPDSPILLFTDGSTDFNTPKALSIVGTRNITSYGKGFIKELITDLKTYQPTIVSGFAYGCDIEAHKQAFEYNLATFAVLAHGFDTLYPKAHKKYAHSVLQNGAFITEFWHDEPPLRENFLKRNRIVAGISQATIVIESAEKGGALVTADIANSYNRDVFALAGRTTDVFSRGCNNLIKYHKAQMITSAEDVVKALNWDVSKKPAITQTQLFIDLDETEQKIYTYLQKNGKQLLDVIAIDCNIPVFQLSSILITMELNGVVKPLPGKLFEV